MLVVESLLTLVVVPFLVLLLLLLLLLLLALALALALVVAGVLLGALPLLRAVATKGPTSHAIGKENRQQDL